jgi:hypothetical protein
MRFQVLIPLVGPNARSGILEHDVALAMEPYRSDAYADEYDPHTWWSWYAIDSETHTKADGNTYAVIGTDGKWYCQCHPTEIDPRDKQEGYTIPLEEWEAELDREFWDRLSEHERVVRIRCKD